MFESSILVALSATIRQCSCDDAARTIILRADNSRRQTQQLSQLVGEFAFFCFVRMMMTFADVVCYKASYTRIFWIVVGRSMSFIEAVQRRTQAS